MSRYDLVRAERENKADKLRTYIAEIEAAAASMRRELAELEAVEGHAEVTPALAPRGGVRQQAAVSGYIEAAGEFVQ